MATLAPTTFPYRPWRLTVTAYLRMIEAGILTEQDRVFLWKGRLFEKMTKGRPHTLVSLRIYESLRRLVPASGCYVEQEQPVATVHRRDTMPEPDLMMVRGGAEDYAHTPMTSDVPLIVEVADSTLAFDLGPKMRLYAAESVPIYWVAGVKDRQIDVFDGPSGKRRPASYANRITYRAGDRVPVTIDGILIGHIDVDEVFMAGDPWR